VVYILTQLTVSIALWFTNPSQPNPAVLTQGQIQHDA